MNTEENNAQLSQSSVSKSVFLTGKCEEDFLINIYYNEDTNQASDERKKEFVIHHALKWFERQDKRLKTALIIEWLDSIGINITIEIDVNNSANSCEDGCENCESCYDTWNSEYKYCICVFTEIKNKANDYSTSFSENNFQLRKDALENAIQKANELYNAKVVEAEH